MHSTVSAQFSLFKQRSDGKYVVVLSTTSKPYVNSRSDWEPVKEFSSREEYEQYRQEVLLGANVFITLHI